ncbi:50S ribosomal protein L25 [Candidatus Peregrinibacteria bacterium]|nr:50S ribosomal protein L25 [Candidatus Peregrinibacteria bacterium]
MDSFLLEVTARDIAQKAKFSRAAGRIPAVYYGRGKPTMTLSLDYQKFRKVYEKAGENTIIELAMDGKKFPVLVHEVQYEPVSDKFSHVDFIHVDMEKEVTTTVKIVCVGVCPAVKNMGGILDVLKHEIKIKCLPKDLIHSIEVDVSPIVDFHTSIHVKDLKIPSGIKILDNAEDTVVTASPIKVEEEAPKPAEAAAGAVPAEGAVPGAVPAAGAAATPAAAPAKEGKK